MVATVEVVVGELVGHLVQRIRRKHEAAQHRLLGLDGMRRHAQRVDGGRLAPAFALAALSRIEGHGLPRVADGTRRNARPWGRSYAEQSHTLRG